MIIIEIFLETTKQPEPMIIDKASSSKSGVNSSVPSELINLRYRKDASASTTPLLTAALEMLNSKVEIELPGCPSPENFNAEAVNYTVNKIVWWVLKNAQDPAVILKIHPELTDEEHLESANSYNLADYDDLDNVKDWCSDDEQDSHLKSVGKSRQYMKECYVRVFK